MEKRNVPKLRFKGFEDEWKSEVLGRFIKERVEKTESNGEYPLYSLTIEEGVVPKSERYEREFLVKKDGNFKVVYKNDFVYNPMNLRFGALAVYKGDSPVVVSGYYNIFNFNNENSNFWINYLKTSRMMYLYNTIATGSLEEKKRVHYSQFKDLNLKIPSLEEQTKIATFLSNVDNIIEEQEGKVKDLEQYKKGMMQKIFKQEVRFRDDNGGEYPEWEEKKLGEIDAKLTRGPFGSALKKEFMISKCENSYKVYEQKHAIRKNCDIGEYYIDKEKYDELKRFEVRPGDFIMSCSGTIGEIFKIPINAEKGIINQALLKIELGNCIDENYFLYCFRKNLDNLETKGSGIKNITSVKFLKEEFLMNIPCLEEQTKIANFLSNIDNIIEEENKKLEDLKLWKKGLLQQMFV